MKFGNENASSVERDNLNNKKKLTLSDVDRIGEFLKDRMPNSFENRTFVDCLLIQTKKEILNDMSTFNANRFSVRTLACLFMEFKAKEILANKIFPEHTSVVISDVIKWLSEEANNKSHEAKDSMVKSKDMKIGDLIGNKEFCKLMGAVTVLIVLVLFYLFALNNRYKSIGNGMVLDSWTEKTFDAWEKR